MRYLSFALSILSLLFIASCKPEPIEPAPEAWRAATGFLYSNKIVYNSAIWDDQLYVLANHGLCKVRPNGEATCVYHAAEIEFPLPMNRDFFVDTKRDPDELVFIPTANPSILDGKRMTIKLTNLAPDIIGFTPGLSRWTIADNGKGQVLAILSFGNYRTTLFLFDVTMEKNKYWDVKEVSATRVNLSELNLYTGISVANHQFLVATIGAANESETWLIDASGNAKKVTSDAIQRVLPVGNTLFADGKFDWLTSTDQGNTWTVIPGGTGLSVLGLLQGHTLVDGRLVAHTGSSIHTIDLSPDGKVGKTDLDLAGLEGNQILNIHEWQGQVFAVTLTGVYIRSVKDFFAKPQ